MEAVTTGREKRENLETGKRREESGKSCIQMVRKARRGSCSRGGGFVLVGNRVNRVRERNEGINVWQSILSV